MAGIYNQSTRIKGKLPSEELRERGIPNIPKDEGQAQEILDRLKYGTETVIGRGGLNPVSKKDEAAKAENPNMDMFGTSTEEQILNSQTDNEYFDPETPTNAASENFALTQTGQGDTNQSEATPNALDFSMDDFDLSAAADNNNNPVKVEGEGVVQETKLPVFGIKPSEITPTEFNVNEFMDDGLGNQLPENERRALHAETIRKQQVAHRSNNRVFQNETREEFKEAYKARGTGPKELDALLSYTHGLGKTMNENMGVSFTNTAGTGVKEGDTVFEILSKELNAEPLSIVNATAETAAFLFLALQNMTTAEPGQSNPSIDENTSDDTFLEMMGVKNQSFKTDGMTGIEVDAMEGLLASQVDLKLREAEGTPSGAGTKVAGKVLAKALEAKGHIIEVDFQPRDSESGKAKGPKVRAYQLTASGAQVASDFSRLGQGNRNRTSAQATTGGTVGTASNYLESSDKIRIGKATEEGSKFFDNYTMTLANSPKMFNSDVLIFDNVLLTFATAENATGPMAVLKSLSQDMLNVEPSKKKKRVDANGREIDSKVNERTSAKANKVRREILAAVELMGSTPVFKTPFFVDPTSRRAYNYTFNANPQESRVHRGAIMGVPINVNLNIDVDLNSNEPVINPKRYDDFDKWASGDKPTKISDSIKFTGAMLAISNLVLTDTRNFSDKDALRRMTGAELNKRAGMGASLLKIIDANYQGIDGKEIKDINFEGLSQTDIKNVIYILSSMDSKNGSGDQKEHGNIIQGYLAAHNIVEAMKRGDTSIRLSIPNPADMASAGRMLIATDIGDRKTISRVGLGLSGVVGYGRTEDSEVFPIGNPRYYFAETMISLTAQQKTSPKGYDDVDFTQELSSIVSDTLNDVIRGPKGAKFADMMAKKTLMITDYGKPASQNTAEVADFIKKTKRDYNDVYVALESAFINNGYTADQIPKFFEEACYEATRSVVDIDNSRAQKTMTELFALFGELPTYEGVRGADIRVGHKTRAIIPGAEMLLTWSGAEGSKISQSFPMKGELVDDLLKPSEAKWIPEAQVWVTPGIASAVVNAFGAMQGHYRETALNAIGLEAVVNKFGKGIFVDQIYDSVSLDFLQAPVFQRAIHKKAIMEVLEHNDAQAYSDAFDAMILKKSVEIRNKGTITLGEKGEYPGFTAKFDEEWNKLSEPIDTTNLKNRKVVDRAEYGKTQTMNKLKQAHKDGIWSPPPYTGRTLGDGFEFVERGVDEVSRSVDSNKFLSLISGYVLNKKFKEARFKWSEETNEEKRRMIEELDDIIAAGFMKAGRNKA